VGVSNPNREHRVEGSHWVSSFNFAQEVTADYDWPVPLRPIDSTLRKARYTAGAVIEQDGFLRIARALESAGVVDESLNIGWFGESEPNRAELELAKTILGGGFAFRTNVYADVLLSNGLAKHPIDPLAAVEFLAGLGAPMIAPGVVPAPTAEAEARQLDELVAVLAHAHSGGLSTSVIFAQCGRRDFDQMMRAINVAAAAGAQRIDFMDSTSSLQPDSMRMFIRAVRAGLEVPVGLSMHAHDDFGLGTALAVSAASAGAIPDVSVNGVSYRCGFAPLEEVVTALEILYGVDTGIELDQLWSLSQTVAAEMAVPVPPLKPLVGEYAFLKHTPGDVIACLRAGERSSPPMSASLHADVVGAPVRWVWDTYSSPAIVRAYAERHDLDLSDEEVASIYAALDAGVRSVPSYPRWLEEGDVARIVDDVLARSRALSE
jgi:isopropylmalate/homocitrate/citramalate synthase